MCVFFRPETGMGEPDNRSLMKENDQRCLPPIDVQRMLTQQIALRSCRIPDDCIDPKRYPLFMARAVLQELIESLQSTRGVKLC